MERRPRQHFCHALHRRGLTFADRGLGIQLKDALKKSAISKDLSGPLNDADGKRELVWQGLSMARELRILQPAPLSKDGKAYREGKALKLDRSLNDDQLFGYIWGDWDGDGAEDVALLQNGERLRIFFKGRQVELERSVWRNQSRFRMGK